MTGPPRLPLLLLWLLLPRDVFEVVAGDLEEDWATREPGRSRGFRFWRLALPSIAAWWLGSRRRLALRRRPGPRPRKGDSRMRTFLHDVALGLRQMLKAPAFSAAIVLTMALGIGANTAIFSLVRGLVLKPVPYHDPERVAFLLGWDAERNENRFNLSMADVLDVARNGGAFEGVAAYSYLSANLTGGPTPERVQAYRVTGNTFDLLGVPPLLGRALAPSDAAPGAEEVAVISHGLWDRAFGRDRSAIGRRVMLNGVPHTVVGVMPQRFEFPVFNFKGDLWTPYRVDEAAIASDRRSAESVVAVARIRPGADTRSAQAEVDAIMRRAAVDHPETNRAIGARVVPMQHLDDEALGAGIAIPFVAVGVVLLLACANVANLLVARGVVRRRELAIRAALGAGRGRIVGQLLAESFVFALAGAAAGLVLAAWALGALRGWLPDLLLQTAPNVNELGLDWTAVAFTGALTVASGLLFGLMPALRTATPDLGDALSGGARTGSGPGHDRLRTLLVGTEVAFSLMLLVAAGQLVRSFDRLQRIDAGFNARDVFTLAVALPEHRYSDADGQRRFFERALHEVESLPGVQSAAFVNVLPFSTYDRGTTVVVDGRPLPERGREPRVAYRSVTARYFETLEIPVVRGRSFSADDRPGTLPVAIVNRELARVLFGGRDPVGARIRPGRDARDWRTIVGVVGDVRHSQLTDRPAAELYVPASQAPGPMMMLAARVDGEAEALAEPARRAVLSVDPDQPVFHVGTLARLVEDSTLPLASAASLVALFGSLALVLAAVGLYSVIAFLVSQQTREFGVRIALGAQPNAVVGLVLWRGMRIALGGALAGLLGAAAVTQLLAGLLVGISPGDFQAYGAAVALLVLVSLAACAIPARRATRVDPVQALRAE